MHTPTNKTQIHQSLFRIYMHKGTKPCEETLIHSFVLKRRLILSVFKLSFFFDLKSHLSVVLCIVFLTAFEFWCNWYTDVVHLSFIHVTNNRQINMNAKCNCKLDTVETLHELKCIILFQHILSGNHAFANRIQLRYKLGLFISTVTHTIVGFSLFSHTAETCIDSQLYILVLKNVLYTKNNNIFSVSQTKQNWCTLCVGCPLGPLQSPVRGSCQTYQYHHRINVAIKCDSPCCNVEDSVGQPAVCMWLCCCLHVSPESTLTMKNLKTPKMPKQDEAPPLNFYCVMFYSLVQSLYLLLKLL